MLQMKFRNWKISKIHSCPYILLCMVSSVMFDLFDACVWPFNPIIEDFMCRFVSLFFSLCHCSVQRKHIYSFGWHFPFVNIAEYKGFFQKFPFPEKESFTIVSGLCTNFVFIHYNWNGNIKCLNIVTNGYPAIWNDLKSAANSHENKADNLQTSAKAKPKNKFSKTWFSNLLNSIMSF